jgi:hypothetical protein
MQAVDQLGERPGRGSDHSREAAAVGEEGPLDAHARGAGKAVGVAEPFGPGERGVRGVVREPELAQERDLALGVLAVEAFPHRVMGEEELPVSRAARIAWYDVVTATATRATTAGPSTISPFAPGSSYSRTRRRSSSDRAMSASGAVTKPWIPDGTHASCGPS